MEWIILILLCCSIALSFALYNLLKKYERLEGKYQDKKNIENKNLPNIKG